MDAPSNAATITTKPTLLTAPLESRRLDRYHGPLFAWARAIWEMSVYVRLAYTCTLGLALLGFVRSDVRAQEPDAHRLAMEGRNLTGTQVSALEAQLRKNADNLSLRIKLLSYYFRNQFNSPEARAARQAHVLWIIRHHPEAEVAGLPCASLNERLDAVAFREASKLWMAYIEDGDTNTAILGNAARFFLHTNRTKAEQYLTRARELEPDNPEWSKRLGHLYRRFARTGETVDAATAKKSLAAYEEALPKQASQQRYYLLGDIAKAALWSGELSKARKYATELLDAAVEQRPDWNYGNAVHHGNLILGHVVLLEGDLDMAEQYLLKAGKTPGSPQLNSFGPNMVLALELLKHERKEPVIEYLKLCGKFWKKSQTDTWIAVIEGGGIPSFGANLRY